MQKNTSHIAAKNRHRHIPETIDNNNNMVVVKCPNLWNFGKLAGFPRTIIRSEDSCNAVVRVSTSPGTETRKRTSMQSPLESTLLSSIMIDTHRKGPQHIAIVCT